MVSNRCSTPIFLTATSHSVARRCLVSIRESARYRSSRLPCPQDGCHDSIYRAPRVKWFRHSSIRYLFAGGFLFAVDCSVSFLLARGLGIEPGIAQFVSRGEDGCRASIRGHRSSLPGSRCWANSIRIHAPDDPVFDERTKGGRLERIALALPPRRIVDITEGGLLIPDPIFARSRSAGVE